MTDSVTTFTPLASDAYKSPEIDWFAEWQATSSANIRLWNAAKPIADQVHDLEACGDGQPIGVRAVSGKSGLTVGDLRALQAALIQPYVPASGAVQKAQAWLAEADESTTRVDPWEAVRLLRRVVDFKVSPEESYEEISTFLATTAPEPGTVGILRQQNEPSPSPEPDVAGARERLAFAVDDLAQEIRRVDGNHDLGAGALAEALMPFILSAYDRQGGPDHG